jgi:hypothetical protein
MAHSSECRDRYAQNSLDTADIVREAIFRQLTVEVRLQRLVCRETAREHIRRAVTTMQSG